MWESEIASYVGLPFPIFGRFSGRVRYSEKGDDGGTLDEAFETKKKDASKRSIHRDPGNSARRRRLGDRQCPTKAAYTTLC